MRTARRYLAVELSKSIALVTFSLLGLFIFFSVIDELDQLGKSSYAIYHILWLELLSLPNRFYDLLPITLLIGTTLGLATLAQRHELVILRVSGVSSFKLLRQLCLALLPLITASLLIAEFVTPRTEIKLQEAKLLYKGSVGNSGQMRSGMWFRENIANDSVRMINIESLKNTEQLGAVHIYELKDNKLQFLITSQSAHFANGKLTLEHPLIYDYQRLQAQILNDQLSSALKISTVQQYTVNTQITQGLLVNKTLTPERMSFLSLVQYVNFLEKNHLLADRQLIAIWRKLIYPLTLFIMIAIATPIAFLQSRRGGVGIKMFTSIILGVGFFMANQLSLNYGLLSKWPAWATALTPSAIVLIVALLALWIIDHRNRLALFLKK